MSPILDSIASSRRACRPGCSAAADSIANGTLVAAPRPAMMEAMSVAEVTWEFPQRSWSPTWMNISGWRRFPTSRMR